MLLVAYLHSIFWIKFGKVGILAHDLFDSLCLFIGFCYHGQYLSNFFDNDFHFFGGIFDIVYGNGGHNGDD